MMDEGFTDKHELRECLNCSEYHRRSGCLDLTCGYQSVIFRHMAASDLLFSRDWEEEE